MQEVQTKLKAYFNSRSFFRGMMAADFVVYGLGFVLLIVGSFVAVVNEAFVNLGIIMFWAGIVFGFAKKDDIGLTIGLSAYTLFFLVMFILYLAGAFYIHFFAFGTLCHVIVATLLLIATIRGSEYFKRYQQNKQLAIQANAAQIAMASQNTRPIFCASCGKPLDADATFCPTCGAKQLEKKFCSKCGTEAAGTAVFCSKCGANI
jgi:hypothetical protein